MRKLLLNSTAIATVAALTASVAVADVSISASTEMKYTSRSHKLQQLMEQTYRLRSNFNFSNKTDSGLTVGYNVDLNQRAAATTIDESSFSIAGGFGKVVLGQNDGAADTLWYSSC